ncbi:MAG TPA: formyltransferase family protein [Chitinophagaceae bacterium]|nr:formyltransferase family protein [Chitinophagaceae bacterium]
MAVGNQKRIVLWCGSAPNQKALAVKIAEQFGLSGIVVSERSGTAPRRKYSEIPALIWDRLRFRSIYKSWKKLLHYYDQRFPSWPDVPVLRVPDINNDETASFTKDLQPALIVVSGTALVKEKLLNTEATVGIINLHTGLSPYVKGGPNCTNWCIANDDWQLVGNTIMWLNKGIDSGNIITSECIDIRDNRNLFEAHKRVMEHAHDLYLRAIDYLLHGQPPYNAVPQSSLGKGSLFLTKMWTASQRKKLLRNWAKRKTSGQVSTPVTIPLPAQNG